MKQLINEAKRLQQLANIKEATPAALPSDVKSLQKAKLTASTVQSREKNINTANEFPGAFENWFKGLGYAPGKISKSFIRSTVEKVLTDLGYK